MASVTASGVVDSCGQDAGLGVPEVDHVDVPSLGAVLRLGTGGEQCLDVADDAGEEAQETEFFAEAAAGFLFGVGGLVEGEGDGEGGLGFVEVGDVVDEGMLGSCVDEAERRGAAEGERRSRETGTAAVAAQACPAPWQQPE
jgi:hypothetical protein